MTSYPSLWQGASTNWPTPYAVVIRNAGTQLAFITRYRPEKRDLLARIWSCRSQTWTLHARPIAESQTVMFRHRPSTQAIQRAKKRLLKRYRAEAGR